MFRRTKAYVGRRSLTGIILSAFALLTLPALSTAASGGGGPSGGAGMGPSGGTNTGSSGTQTGDGTVSDRASGITIVTRASGFLNRRMTFTGRVSRGDAGRVIEIQRSGRQTKGRWITTARSTVGSRGFFRAEWQADSTGRFAVRAVLGHPAAGHSASAWPTVRVIVYRMAIATVYGPGFWGSKTACGQTLRRQTLGTANRTLPCGTKVSIYFRGRTIVVPVIDRGPYANHADWDLTQATARALHMNGTEHVGAAAISRG